MVEKNKRENGAPVADAPNTAAAAENIVPAAADGADSGDTAIDPAISAAGKNTRSVNSGTRYDALFDGLHFSVSDTDRTYTNDRSGTVSKKLANAALIFRGGFAATPASVYVRRDKGGRQVFEFTIMGTMRQSALTPLDEPAKADLITFKRWATGEYVKWLDGMGDAAKPRKSQDVGIDAAGDYF